MSASIVWKPAIVWQPERSALTTRRCEIDAGDGTQRALRALADLLDDDDSLMLMSLCVYPDDASEGLIFEAVLEEDLH